MGIDNVGSSTFRKMESTALSGDGKIDATEAKKLGEAAKKEDPAVAKQVLYGDAFENTDARAAYSKAAGITEKVAPSPLAGQAVGAATISRTVGDQKGYENPMQAVAAARLSGVPNAAVVSNGGRYYAVEVNKSVPGQQSSAAGVAFGLGPRDEKAIETARTNLKDARAETPPDGAKLIRLQQELASKTYGLPPSSFNVCARREDRVPTTIGPNGIPTGINIQNGLFQASGGDAGAHGMAGNQGKTFDPAAPTAIAIDAGTLEGRTVDTLDANNRPGKKFMPPDTDQAAGVLEHEATHLEDADEAKAAVKKWGGDFTKDPQGFDNWLTGQLKDKKITNADFSRISSTAHQNGANSEIHAHMSTTVDAIRNGTPDVAKEQMKDYAISVKQGQASPQEFNHVLSEASKAYKTMTKDQKAQFKDALKAAGDIFKNFDPDKGTYLKQPIKDN